MVTNARPQPRGLTRLTLRKRRESGAGREGAGGGLLGGLTSALGGNAAMLANVVSGFSKLGLSADTAKKFVPIILDFLRKHVAADVVTKIEAALRA